MEVPYEKEPQKAFSPKRQKEVYSGVEEPPTYYSNSAEIGTSLWDIRINWGEIKEATKERILVKHLATVYMSPSHAKAVAELLNEKIKEYEETFGPIPSRPDSTDTAETPEK